MPDEGKQQIYTLLVEVGRKEGDGLPAEATGAALMCYASGVDEAEAVRETVALLKRADLAPLDVSGYGTLAEREAIAFPDEPSAEYGLGREMFALFRNNALPAEEGAGPALHG